MYLHRSAIGSVSLGNLPPQKAPGLCHSVLMENTPLTPRLPTVGRSSQPVLERLQFRLASIMSALNPPEPDEKQDRSGEDQTIDDEYAHRVLSQKAH